MVCGVDHCLRNCGKSGPRFFCWGDPTWPWNIRLLHFFVSEYSSACTRVSAANTTCTANNSVGLCHVCAQPFTCNLPHFAHHAPHMLCYCSPRSPCNYLVEEDFLIWVTPQQRSLLKSRFQVFAACGKEGRAPDATTRMTFQRALNISNSSPWANFVRLLCLVIVVASRDWIKTPRLDIHSCL